MLENTIKFEPYVLLTKIDHFFKKNNIGQPVLSLVEIYLRWGIYINRETVLMKIKKNRAFCGNSYKILERTI